VQDKRSTVRRSPGLGPILLLAFLAVRPAPAGAQEAGVFGPPVGWPPPQVVALREADLLFRDPDTESFNNLSFHFLGRLDDGTLFTFSVFRWSYALWGGWGLFVLVHEPGGEPYVHEERLPEKAVTLAEDRFELRFGVGSISGSNGRYRIRLDLPGFACDLDIRPILPPWQPGDGYARLTAGHGAFLRTGVHSPWAATSGTVVLRGRPLPGRGQCYGDRTRFSLPASRLNPDLVTFRGFSPAEVREGDRWLLNVLHWRSHEDYGSLPIASLILAHGGEWVLTARDFSVVPADFRKEENARLPWPRTIRLQAAQGGYRLSGDFRAELVHVTDVRHRLPAIFRPIASLFVKMPVIFRLAGVFRGTLTLPDGATRELELFGQGEVDLQR
jgi:hypothetical protein